MENVKLARTVGCTLRGSGHQDLQESELLESWTSLHAPAVLNRAGCEGGSGVCGGVGEGGGDGGCAGGEGGSSEDKGGGGDGDGGGGAGDKWFGGNGSGERGGETADDGGCGDGDIDRGNGGDGGGGCGRGVGGGAENGEGGSEGGGIGGKMGVSTTTERLSLLRPSLAATAEPTESRDRLPVERAFASSTPPSVVTESAALTPEKVLLPTLTLAASSRGVSVIPDEESISTRENVAVPSPSMSFRRPLRPAVDVRTQLGYRLLHAFARASNAACVGGMIVTLKSCSTTTSVAVLPSASPG